MSDKVAIVTGSSRGIGRASALRLAADGAKVVVNYNSDVEGAKEVVAAIETAGGQAVAVQGDSADPAQLRTLFDSAELHYGGVDVFVHNAGTYVQGPLAEAKDEDYDRTFAINTRGTFAAFREAATRVRDGGRVVYVSSISTKLGLSENGIYAASKAAGEQLVRTFAREVGGRQITVNSVLPGPTNTRMFNEADVPADELVARTALGRLGEPDDIAEVVGFLASEAARWVTGQSITADGGLT